MSHNSAHRDSNGRAARIRRVVEEHLRLRDSAEAIDDAALVAAHAELMPELAEELRKIALIERSMHQARSTQDYDTALDGRQTIEVPVVRPLPAAFGRYKVGAFRARGGFADVYDGHDTKLDCPVAIKVLRPEREPAAAIEAVMLEARFHARLRHPGMLRVHDVGEQDEFSYIVSDLIDGPSLRDWLAEHRPTWPQAVQIAADVADTLHYVRGQGIVHRDIKPANILLTKDQRAVLADLGLALSASGSELHPGQIVGTHGYMSPEQARGESVDGRTDIYSLGTVLYEMLTNRTPCGAGEITELLRQARDHEPQRLSLWAAEVPAELERVCVKAMAQRADDRYATAGEFAHDLNVLLRKLPEPPVRSRVLSWIANRTTAGPRTRLIGLVTVVMLAAVASGFVIRNRWNAAAKTGLTVPAASSEADRRIAAQVLGLGGSVDVEVAGGASREVQVASDLPAQPFRLRWIMMPKCRSADDDLVGDFRVLDSLVGVDLSATPITDDSLVHLSAIPSLTDVYVHHTGITDDGLSAILRLARLRRLHVAGTRITDATLRGLAGNQTLYRLDVSGTAITDDGLRHIAEIPFLEILNVAQNDVGDDGLRHLIRLRHIQEFGIEETRISEAGLAGVEHWPLKKLGCSLQQVSSAWTARHPNCVVRAQ